MSRYSREEIQKWKEVFKAADVNNDHRIDVNELIEAARKHGFDMDDAQAAEEVKFFDNNNSGTIEFSEFLKVLGERGT